MQILLIEDNIPDAEYLKELLSGDHLYSILAASRLSEGLALLEENQADLVLLDLGLPDSQGLDTARAVRRKAPRTPIIVLTGLNDDNTALQAVKTDIQDYLIKGQINRDLLMRSITYAVERKRAVLELQESEEFFRATYLRAPIGIEMLDLSGRYLQGNGRLSRMLGYSEEELRQKNFQDITYPPDLPAELRLLNYLLRGRIRTYRVEKRYIHKEGRLVWVRVTSSIAQTTTPYRICVVEDITRSREAEEELKESEARLRFVTEHSPDSIFIQDRELRYIWVARDNAVPLDEFIGKTDYDRLIPEDAARLTAVKRDVIEQGRPITIELPLIMEGEQKFFEATYEPWRDASGGVTGLAGYEHDITARKREEAALKRWADIFRNTRIGIAVSGDGRTLDLINPAFAEMHGYSVEELMGKAFSTVYPPEVQKDIAEILQRADEKGFQVQESIHVRKDGTRFPVLLNMTAVKGENGKVLYRIANVQDITEQKKAEEVIRYRTYHDLLTGLPNRADLMMRLQAGLAEAERKQRKLALLHIDLDRFRVINDSLGHAIGDKVIQTVTKRLGAIVRQGDTLARIGSDEFIILLADLKRAEDAAPFAQKVLQAMREPLTVDSHELYTTVSVGISVFPDDSAGADGLMKFADIAVSAVKDWGRNNFQFFNPALNRRSAQRLLLESHLRQSLERGEILVRYQPQISLATGKIIGVEALSRWNHPELGLLEPKQFIPVAEEIGFISAIDEWVLRTAAAQNSEWRKAGLPPLCVGVNISAQQFQQPSFVQKVEDVLRQTGLPPEYLEIEITESTAMRDIERSVPNLDMLHRLGVDLAIDDFGTGYSSLNYLKRFPVHKLKIDQSFIKGIVRDKDDQAIVRAVIAMSHSLGMRVIAEGVETREQYTFLQSSQCDEIQGYLFSEPVSGEKIRELLAA